MKNALIFIHLCTVHYSLSSTRSPPFYSQVSKKILCSQRQETELDLYYLELSKSSANIDFYLEYHISTKLLKANDLTIFHMREKRNYINSCFKIILTIERTNFLQKAPAIVWPDIDLLFKKERKLTGFILHSN